MLVMINRLTELLRHREKHSEFCSDMEKFWRHGENNLPVVINTKHMYFLKILTFFSLA